VRTPTAPLDRQQQADTLNRLLPDANWRAEDLSLYEVSYRAEGDDIGPVEVWLPQVADTRQLAMLVLQLEQASDVRVERIEPR